MALNVNSIGIVKPRLLHLTTGKSNVQQANFQAGSSKQTLNLSGTAASIKASSQVHDTKTADLTDMKENAGALAGGIVMDATTQGVLSTILKRTLGVPGVADADKIIEDTLKNVKDPSIVKNVENAWSQWKKNYYKNGNISFGEAAKAGINLIPTMGRGICNGILETATKVTQHILGTDGAKAVSNVVNTVSNGIKTIGDTVVAPFSGLINLCKGDKKAANAAFYKVWTDVKNTGKSIKNAAVSTGKYLYKTAMNFAQNPLNTTVELVKGVGKGIQTTVKTVGNVAKKVGGAVKKGFKKLWKKIRG